MRTFVLWTTLIAVWSLILAVVISNPAIMDTDRRGPFHGISGYWCWITDGYKIERISSDYLIMFSAAFFSFVLYSLIFLRLRGNLVIDGWRFHFKRSKNVLGWRSRQLDDQAMAVARQMLIYPVAYTLMILPIAITRFMTWAGHTPPFEATIFSAAVFLLSGLVNVVLFCSTRRVLPPQSLKIRMLKFRISNPTIVAPPLPPPEAPAQAQEDSNSHEDPYYASHRTSDYDPYYANHSVTDVDLESLNEKFNEKIVMPEPSLAPAPSFISETSSTSSMPISRTPSRSPSPPGGRARSRGAHLPEIQVPNRDSFTGATSMSREPSRPDVYRNVDLGS